MRKTSCIVSPLRRTRWSSTSGRGILQRKTLNALERSPTSRCSSGVRWGTRIPSSIWYDLDFAMAQSTSELSLLTLIKISRLQSAASASRRSRRWARMSSSGAPTATWLPIRLAMGGSCFSTTVIQIGNAKGALIYWPCLTMKPTWCSVSCALS